MVSILIVTKPRDFHAQAVTWALRLRGHTVTIWCPTDFPEGGFGSLGYGMGEAAECDLPPITTELRENIDVIWMRRFPRAANITKIHPSDRLFAQREVFSFLQACLDTFQGDIRWVNPVVASSLADLKPRQLRVATSLGLSVPETLITNDGEKLEQFFNRCDGRLIYKPLNPMSWEGADGQKTALYTNRLSWDDVSDRETIALSPGIYQRMVDKEYELRVVVMGDRLFAGRIDTAPGSEASVDYRIGAVAGEQLGFSRAELPSEISTKCINLVKTLGLEFGVLDLIAEPSGRHVFLEINEMGQFLGLETDGKMPILDNFCDFLCGPEGTAGSEVSVDAFLASSEWEAILADPDEGHLPDNRIIDQPE